MQFSAADITGMLAAMGETVTLQNRALRRTVTAVYAQDYNPGSPLDGITAHEQYSITCATADVTGIDAKWTATVRSTTRPVLSVEPDGAGFTRLILGDEETC